jgi:hypothetical protein
MFHQHHPQAQLLIQMKMVTLDLEQVMVIQKEQHQHHLIQ